MNILLIGGGGREHALLWALARSPRAGALYVAPGNAGMGALAEHAPVDVQDAASIIDFCQNNAIGLVVIGPEAPLVAGLADALVGADIPVFGPSKTAAALEGSKAFTKEICTEYNIPTAAYGTFTDAETAKAFIREHGAPIVVKADGLAAGKGVIIAEDEAAACKAVEDMFGGAFGEAGQIVVVEEFLTGEEASFFALSDGKKVIPFGSAQDHKRVYEGDTGPNTGGMGTYSPAPVMDAALEAQVMETIITPLVRAMAERGTPYKGIIFAGLMIENGAAQLLEINVRFGDPETQVLLPRLESDLLELFLAVAEGTLAGHAVHLSDRAALCVVMATKGYPGGYQKGSEIRGVENAAAQQDVLIFHAGTKEENGALLASGGRVLGVTALGDTVEEAQQHAYAAVDSIDWPEGFCRRDIGWRAIPKNTPMTAEK